MEGMPSAPTGSSEGASSIDTSSTECTSWTGATLLDARDSSSWCTTDILDGALGEDMERREAGQRFARAHSGLDADSLRLARDADENTMLLGWNTGMDADGVTTQLRTQVLLGTREEAVHVDITVTLQGHTKRSGRRKNCLRGNAAHVPDSPAVLI